MATMGTATTSALPERVSRALDDFVAAAREAFAGDLVSVVLYGSAAEGRLRATSDVNVLVVLRAFDPGAAARLAPAMRIAEAAVRLQAMFVLASELPEAAVAFAEKFDDVRRRRVILHGADPFATLVVPRDALCARLRQTTLNLVLRMRSALVTRGTREEQMAIAVADAAGPMRAAAASLLELEGRPVAHAKEALEALVAGSGPPSWREALAAVSAAREGRPLPPGAAAKAHAVLVEVARHLHERASALR